MKIAIEVDYKNRRKEEYPSLADQLDAIWKGGEEAEAMRKRIMAIKDTFPKTNTNAT